jgi:hypothetical protein
MTSLVCTVKVSVRMDKSGRKVKIASRTNKTTRITLCGLRKNSCKRLATLMGLTSNKKEGVVFQPPPSCELKVQLA